MSNYPTQERFAADYRGESAFWIVMEQLRYEKKDDIEGLNEDTIVIRSAPSFQYDGSEVEEGFFDFNSDISSLRAYGKYDTFEEARKQVELLFGPVRKVDAESSFCFVPNALEFYKKGKYKHALRLHIPLYCNPFKSRFVRKSTTDKEIASIALDCESLANSDKMTLGKYAVEELKKYRRLLSLPHRYLEEHFTDPSEEVFFKRVVRRIEMNGATVNCNFVIYSWSKPWIYLVDLDEDGQKISEIPEYVLHLFERNKCLADKRLYYLNTDDEICEIQHLEGSVSTIVKLPKCHEMYQFKYERDRDLY